MGFTSTSAKYVDTFFPTLTAHYSYNFVKLSGLNCKLKFKIVRYVPGILIFFVHRCNKQA